jgi:sugar/nucleoside kinase (ribokinase family)
LLLQDLEKENVDTAGLIRVGLGDSGQVVGFVDEKGDRALYIDSGVNDIIRLHELKAEYVARARFLHLTSFVGEESFETQKQLLELLPETRVSFDPGTLYARKGYASLEPIIRKTHVLMPNHQELALITGEKDYCKGADSMISKGIAIVAVKLGADGCYVTDGRERLRIEAFKVKAVDTTGAGDAFCAGFLYGILKKRSIFECGQLGNFVASRCVTRFGARAGLPYERELSLLK